jgi:hypothetical protein
MPVLTATPFRYVCVLWLTLGRVCYTQRGSALNGNVTAPPSFPAQLLHISIGSDLFFFSADVTICCAVRLKKENPGIAVFAN